MAKLKVIWNNGMDHPSWVRAFATGAEHEVIRETKAAYFIRPFESYPALEKRVSKATLRLTGFKPAYGVLFRLV